MACSICYLLRIVKSEDRTRIIQNIKKDINEEGVTGLDFKFFDTLASEIAEEALSVYQHSDQDISVNNPLKENLVVLLTCIVLGHHVLICGKPGSSKTLSINIVSEILRENNLKKREMPRLKNFKKKAMFNKFFGSKVTTSESVQKKCLEVTMKYVNFDPKKYRSSMQNEDSESSLEKPNMVLVYDEIGLAELAPDRPNKVLHSFLDPGSEDIDTIRRHAENLGNYQQKTDDEKLILNENIKSALKGHVSFIGISNWALDMSMTNRAIFVARGNMNNDDLIATSKGFFDNHMSKNEELKNITLSSCYKDCEEIIHSVFKKIAESYQNFRKCKNCPLHDKNLHGSRDFYYLIKYIIHNLDPSIFSSAE
jgi:nucleoside-triphosphatase THEP1